MRVLNTTSIQYMSTFGVRDVCGRRGGVRRAWVMCRFSTSISTGWYGELH